MPAVVIVGAQWGDEGKGKATDLLGSRVDYVVKFNGGNNAGHTVVIGDEKYALHLLPERHPHARAACRSSATASSSTSRCCSRRSTGSTRAASTPRKLLISANAHVIADYNRTLDKVDRALPRQPQDRHDRSRHRPDVRRQDEPPRHPRPGPVRREDPAAEGRGRPRAQEPDPRQGLQPPRDRGRRDRRGAARRTSTGSRPMVADTSLLLQRGARPRQDRAARGRPGHAARRRPRHLPVRDVVVGDRRRRVHRLGHPADRDRPGHRHRQGVHDARRRGPVPDRAVRRRRRAPAQDRRRVRHHDRPAAPLRLVRRADRALRRAHQRRHRLRPHQARRADRAGTRSRSASPTTSTACGTTRCR